MSKRLALLFSVLLLTLVLSACGRDREEESILPTKTAEQSAAEESQPPAAEPEPTVEPRPGRIDAVPLEPAAGQRQTLMARIAPEASGIDFENFVVPDNLNPNLFNGAGVAVGDVDGDSLVDIYLVCEQCPSRLYRNLGDMQFEEITAAAGLEAATEEGGVSIGAHFADIDNDGDLDLFVTNWNVSNRLFRNDGGAFTDITDEAGVAYTGGATTTTFADYDRDGDLDFYVATYRPSQLRFEPNPGSLKVVNGQPVIPPELEGRVVLVDAGGGYVSVLEAGEPDLLYQNQGDGVFVEVAEAAGIVGNDWGLSTIFTDMDNDGWPDLYVTNDFWTPDRFYHNQGDGTFALIDPENVQHSPMSSMGVDAADINNDGLTDYFVADMVSRDHELHMMQHGSMGAMPMAEGDEIAQIMRNGLFVNNGDGTFTDVAFLADVAATEWTWSPKFADFDLDGYVDLFVTNGMIADLMDSDTAARSQEIHETEGREAALAFLLEHPQLVTRDLAFRNRANGTFEEVSALWGLDTAAINQGVALADFDGDGDQDIIANAYGTPANLFRNDAEGSRLAVKLAGNESNAQGLGARVTLVTDQGSQVRTMTTSGGYLSGHEALVVFGLGNGGEIHELRVEWPSGHVQHFPADSPDIALLPDMLYTLTEPTGPAEVNPAKPLTPIEPQFVDVAAEVGIDFVHSERSFDDFAPNHLLPRKLSTLGPGLAWGDADSDGDDDLYIAGASGQAGGLFENQGDGQFVVQTEFNQPWPRGREEMAPLWWHSGQTENPELLLSYSAIERPDPLGARFAADSATPFDLAETDALDINLASGGALAAADFDGDGDLDLFVGGRADLDTWPLPVTSHLFANEEGELIDVTADSAPALADLGLATGALWSDIDNDGDLDLVVATEWGPVRVFVNDGGELSDKTEAAGLTQWTGLWNGVTAGDFDGDGDMDLAATNLGLNTRYSASPEEPAMLFAGDLDGNGSHDLVEAAYVDGTLYPLRERGMMGAQMPFILDKYETFAAYAAATLDEIYGDMLANGTRLEATTLAHTLFVNDGSGQFSLEPLPMQAQVSIGFGVTAADLDNDGYDDLYLAGNFHGADHESMAYDGGVSYWLRNRGEHETQTGQFEIVPASTSGLSVPYEARGVAAADYDDDGWIDLAIGVNNSATMLFKNQGTRDNRSIRVRLAGSPANPTGVGARIIATLPHGQTVTREVRAGDGYLSQESATQIIGLGAADAADVEVHWPDGTVTNLVDILAGDAITITQSTN